MKKFFLKVFIPLFFIFFLIAVNVYISSMGIHEETISPTDTIHTEFSASDVSASDVSASDVSPTELSSEISAADVSLTDEIGAESETDAEPVEVDLNQYATVTVKSAALRKSNSTNSSLIKYISKGKKVIILQTKKAWYKVDFNGAVGWVHSDCLELIRNRELEATLYASIPEQITGEVQSLSGTATEKYIKQIASEHSVAGLTVAVIKNGEVAYHYEYGYADKDDNKKATVDTKFRIASLSKVFTSMMAVKLAEDGKLDLDAHIGDILGLSVRNPNHKSTDITTRMLLTHTSSFIDRSTIFSSSIKKDFKSSYVFTSAKPGTRHVYSNFGMGVAGAVVEQASGQYLTDYAQSAFFDSMGIDAGFDGTKLKDKSNVADCMVRGSVEKTAKELVKKKETNAVGRNHSLAAGGLLISAVDMARVTTILINNGTYNGERYLSENTISEFHSPQFEASKYTQCIGIRKSDTVLPDRTMYYHTGAAYGVFSVMAYDLEDKSGVVVLSTGSLDYSDDNGIRTICSDVMNLVYEDILNQ